jgi:hypothetical protein
MTGKDVVFVQFAGGMPGDRPVALVERVPQRGSRVVYRHWQLSWNERLRRAYRRTPREEPPYTIHPFPAEKFWASPLANCDPADAAEAEQVASLQSPFTPAELLWDGGDDPRGCDCVVCHCWQPESDPCPHVFWCDACNRFAGLGVTDSTCRHQDPRPGRAAANLETLLAGLPAGLVAGAGFREVVVARGGLHPYCGGSRFWLYPGLGLLVLYRGGGGEFPVWEWVVYDAAGSWLADAVECREVPTDPPLGWAEARLLEAATAEV